MKSKIKILDIFQIVGFVTSVFISLLLVSTGQDTIGSVTLGLVLATMVQLFDLQLRQSDSEERLLSATSLNQALYKDRWLLSHIQQIVNDYMVVRSGWFQLFSDRATDVIADTRNTLHLMAEGYMVTEPYSSFTFGRHFAQATNVQS